MKFLFSILIILAATTLWTSQSNAQQTLDWIQADIDIYNLEVLRVDGRRLTVRVSELQGRRTFRVPQGFDFYIDGAPTDVTALRPRQRLTAYVTRSRSGELVLVDAGPPRAAVPATPPAPPVIAMQVPEPAPAMLPKTGSLVPLAGLAGLAMLGLAFGMRRLRSHR